MSNDEMAKILEQQENMRADKYPLPEYNVIGKRGVRRIDGYEKASGFGEYTMDVQLPGMLFLRVLACPYPHAKIKRMDTSKAEALPGVRAVLRYDDPELPEKVDVSGHFLEEEPVLHNVGYWQGMPMGVAVAAETEDIANEALKLVEIEWEERPFNLDQEEALKPGAPLSNPEWFPGGNLIPPMWHDYVYDQGDVEQGFREADQIIEFKARRGRHSWVGPERPCGVFRWNGEYPELWVKQQRPHLAKRQVAQWFNVPVSQVQIHALFQGASFGGWSQMSWNEGPNYIAGLLSKRTGRPVKWMFTRREDFYGGSMDDAIYDAKVGFKKDGTVTAVKSKAVFSRDGWNHSDHLAENTQVPNIHADSEGAYLNVMPMHAIRCEQQMNCFFITAVFDHVADALGMDPVEVALKNDGCHGHKMADLMAEKRALGFPQRDSLRECIEAGKKAMDWDKKWHPPGTKKLPNGKLHGMGFAWTHEWNDSAGSGAMAIRIERDDGTARILSIGCDCGVNAETAYCQIAADELGMRYEDVHYRQFHEQGFARMTPDSATNLSVNGYCIRNAARLLKRRILEVATTPRITARTEFCFAAPFAGYSPEDLDIKDSAIFVKDNPSKRMTLKDFVGPSFIMGAMDVGSTEPLFAYGWQIQRGAYEGPPSARHLFVRQAHFVELEIDTETGDVEVTKVVTTSDVGKAISPEGCEGQAYGGAVMGVSRVRGEDIVYCPVTGVLLNGNLADYKVATILDCGPIDTIIVETGMGYGPYGACGIAEDVASMVPPALYSAVHNAIGKWVDPPYTPDKTLKALGKI